MSKNQDNEPSSIIDLWRIYLLVGITTLAIALVMGYSLYNGNIMTVRYAPLVDAAMEIKLEATIAHLWFEEMISGDRTIDIEDVWSHLDRSQWYAEAMLEGGENPEGKFIPLKDAALRLEIEQTLEDIKHFRTIAQERWKQQTQSGVGSEIDQLFDKTFNGLLVSADDVEITLRQTMRGHLQQFRILQSLLVAVTVILGVVVGFILQRHERRHVSNMLALKAEITERKKAEEESRLHGEVMKNMAEGVYLVGAEDGIIIYANPKFEKMFGYDAGQMNGQHASIVNAPTEKDPTETAREIMEVLNKTGKWHGDVNNIKKNGAPFLCYANCSIFNHPEYGRVIVAVHTDITERRRIENELLQRQTEVAHAARLSSVGEMASSLAHELNQPLCAVMTHAEGCVRLLKTHSLDREKVARKLETIVRQTEYAAEVISRIREFIRKVKPVQKIVDINQIVREAVDLAEAEVHGRGAAVSLELDEKIGKVSADSVQIEQVLMNLIQNGLDAMNDTPAGQRKLTVRSRTSDDMVEVSVADKGKGIAAEHIDNLFESFFSTKTDGLGIGLSISRSIIESHGGTLRFEACRDRGAIFRFTLPALQRAGHEADCSNVRLNSL